MDTRLAVTTIIIENKDEAGKINSLLHENSDYIVGRMGIPYRTRGVSVICVILDGPQDAISALTGKLGMLNGVSSKTIYSKVMGTEV